MKPQSIKQLKETRTSSVEKSASGKRLKVARDMTRVTAQAVILRCVKLLRNVRGEVLAGTEVAVVPVVAGCVCREPQDRGNMIQSGLS